jgi:hypothetical protein
MLIFVKKKKVFKVILFNLNMGKLKRAFSIGLLVIGVFLLIVGGYIEFLGFSTLNSAGNGNIVPLDSVSAELHTLSIVGYSLLFFGFFFIIPAIILLLITAKLLKEV